MRKIILSLAVCLSAFACTSSKVSLQVTRTFDCDVLVIGGGPAGSAAAVCAARHGASTILAERNGCLGGTATTGLVAPFMSSTTPDGKTMLIKGFNEELISRMVAEGKAIHPLDAQIGSRTAYRDKGHHGLTTFDYESLKRNLEAMCTEAGVKLMYHALFVKADVRRGRIGSAYFATKAGIWKVNAKTFIDCTGDADLAYAAGCPTVIGDGAGDLQAVSLFFIVRGVDKAKMDAHNADCLKRGDYEGQWYMNEIKQARENGEFPSWRNKIALFENLDGTYTVNMAQSDGVDGLDPMQITAAEVQQRSDIDGIVKFLRKYVDGCQNCELVATAGDLGVRETRRIEGEYTVTVEDARNSVKYPDAIFCCANSMDIHRKGYVEYVARSTNEPFSVPYRALLPLGIDNLLVAGRCAAAERPVMAAIRVIPPCFAMGQAAGTAAALSLHEGVCPRCLDASLLTAALKQDGACLPE